MLFIPREYATLVGIEALREAHRPYFGGALFILFAVIFSRLASWSAAQVKARRQRKRNRGFLHTLTAEEKGYLACFVQDDRASINLGITDGIAGSLRTKGIIYRQSNAFDMVDGMPYGIQPWALEYLKEHPSLLEGAKGKPLSPIEKLHARY
jgi:hypothetical protein